MNAIAEIERRVLRKWKTCYATFIHFGCPLPNAAFLLRRSCFLSSSVSRLLSSIFSAAHSLSTAIPAGFSNLIQWRDLIRIKSAMRTSGTTGNHALFNWRVLKAFLATTQRTTSGEYLDTTPKVKIVSSVQNDHFQQEALVPELSTRNACPESIVRLPTLTQKNLSARRQGLDTPDSPIVQPGALWRVESVRRALKPKVITGTLFKNACHTSRARVFSVFNKPVNIGDSILHFPILDVFRDTLTRKPSFFRDMAKALTLQVIKGAFARKWCIG